MEHTLVLCQPIFCRYSPLFTAQLPHWTSYLLVLCGQRQHGLRRLPDTSIHNQHYTCLRVAFILIVSKCRYFQNIIYFSVINSIPPSVIYTLTKCFFFTHSIVIYCLSVFQGVHKIVIYCQCVSRCTQNCHYCQCVFQGVHRIVIYCQCVFQGVHKIVIYCQCVFQGVHRIVIYCQCVSGCTQDCHLLSVCFRVYTRLSFIVSVCFRVYTRFHLLSVCVSGCTQDCHFMSLRFRVYCDSGSMTARGPMFAGIVGLVLLGKRLLVYSHHGLSLLNEHMSFVPWVLGEHCDGAQ